MDRQRECITSEGGQLGWGVLRQWVQPCPPRLGPATLCLASLVRDDEQHYWSRTPSPPSARLEVTSAATDSECLCAGVGLGSVPSSSWKLLLSFLCEHSCSAATDRPARVLGGFEWWSQGETLLPDSSVPGRHCPPRAQYLEDGR